MAEVCKPAVGVGAVIVENGKILLVKRANEPNRLKWSIPGGCVNVGESLAEALKKEIKEECGLEIEVGDVACVSEEVFRDGDEIKFHYVIIDFYAKIVGGRLEVGSDALDAKWVNLEEVDSLDVVDFVKRLVDRILGRKSGIYLK
ncbi:NUDIX hydrolase [Archaeoglobus veneficus]|uniref:NUDIX hydrolase n=1 Tax=Archaeoglobus veneficus (strain DSM 11195 / SNP6) TaxID=693661 RepID=F2KQU7_ARCVS|nr:NUDIX hydrolase [Archaeoglobus veneficus]AEA47753.1 NUDIX hydrolase [Archaeoglobus veneficus SNP6]